MMMLVKLYVNGYYQGVQSKSSITSEDQFTFTGLNVQSGESLDVDVIFTAMASGWFEVSWIDAYFSSVAFISP